MKKTEEDGWWRFLAMCLKAKSLNELDALFQLMFTLSERAEIGVREEIFRTLIEGKKTQREIAKDLKTSIANVSRGSNCLKVAKPDLRRFFQDS
ncbi:MAG: trp operon repressor [Verrucomicrobia bacterium]|nr:trp operon repressor [Verrucomicrobiota bacterium]